ncbi:MAG: hypothetical protein KAS23_00925 [Anaerohalosphaera sp.]|nr:hypothetical protein [Anaerohalosphaera sp.]
MNAARALTSWSILPTWLKGPILHKELKVASQQCRGNNKVNGNVDIVSIEPAKMKLDDAFLQLTKGMVH